MPARRNRIRPAGTQIGRAAGLTVWLAEDAPAEPTADYAVEVRAADMRLLWSCKVGSYEEEARIRARKIHSLLHIAGEQWSTEVPKLEFSERAV